MSSSSQQYFGSNADLIMSYTSLDLFNNASFHRTLFCVIEMMAFVITEYQDCRCYNRCLPYVSRRL